MIAVNEVEWVFLVERLQPGDDVASLDAIVGALGSDGGDDGELVVGREQDQLGIFSGRPGLGQDELATGVSGFLLQVFPCLLPLTARERERDNLCGRPAVIRQRGPRPSGTTLMCGPRYAQPSLGCPCPWMLPSLTHVCPPSVDCHQGALLPHEPLNAVMTISFAFAGLIAMLGS